MKTPHRKMFSHFPLTQLAIALGVGILSATQFSHRLSVWLVAYLLSSIAGALSLFFRRYQVCGLLLLVSFFCAGGVLALLDQSHRPANSLKQILVENEIGEREQVVLTGSLIGPVEFAHDRLYLTLDVDRIQFNDAERSTAGTVNVVAIIQNQASEQSYRNIDLEYGDRVAVKASLRMADQFRNPGVSSLTEYLERRNLEAIGSIKSPASITKLGGPRRFSLLGLLYRMRQRLQTAIDATFDDETAGVLDAALLGNRFNLSAGVLERFRSGGTFHVLVISGLHISFLGGIAFLIAKWITSRRSLRFVLASTFVWSYSLAVGAEASVVRAALMFTFVTLGTVLFRRASSLNALGGAAVVLLVHRPKDLFDPSLQLTFLSVLAIVAVAWPLLQKISAIGSWHPTRTTPYPPVSSRWMREVSEIFFWRERKWRKEIECSPHSYQLRKSKLAVLIERCHSQGVLRFLFSSAVVSVSVQLVLLPLLVIYFHRLSLSSIALNIAVSALLAVLAFVAGLALLVSQVSVVAATPVIWLANSINHLMVHSVDPFSRLHIDSIRLPEYSGWTSCLYALYYVPLVVLMVQLSRWEPLSRPVTNQSRNYFVLPGLAQLLLVGLVVVHPWSAGGRDGRLHVDFLDVGQGDSALVTMPDGATLLVDGGGRPNFFRQPDSDRPAREVRSIGEAVVSEYLWWRGIDRVDYVLATHADADHIDGLNDILRNFSVRAAIVARAPASDPEFARFAETLKTTNTPLEIMSAGDVLSFDRVSATVLAPISTSDANAPSGNDDSLVLRLQFGERAILLTGDIEKTAEASILRNGEAVASDVVKVPHHGSRTSSTEAFVLATRPTFAIISVGQTSMFGHPHKEVVERWRAHGAQVLTTGRSGTISVSTDGGDLKVTTYVPRL